MKKLVLGCVALISCTEVTIIEPAISSFEIEAPATVLFPGDTMPLTPIMATADGKYLVLDDAVWDSSDSTVIRVDADGHAIAVRPGEARVTIHSRNQAASVNLQVDSGFVSIEAGVAATCAQKLNRELWCWGSGWTIGDHFTDGSSAVARKVPSPVPLSEITIGSRHVCGLADDGTAYCFGSPNAGADGSGHLRDFSSVPRPVVTSLKFKSISAGWEHTCALTGDGVAYCWGRNYERQLGRADVGVSYAVVPVDTDLRFKQLQANGSNTCGLALDGDAYCWGDWRGYFGDSTIVQNVVKPMKIAVPKLRMFDSSNEDPCGIAFDGDLWCWTHHVEHVARVGKVTSVSVGATHNCVTQNDGRIACFGKNNYGQLGTGNTTESSDLVTPGVGLAFRQIAVGALHTCGITDTGATYCWGFNSDGQLGNGSRAHSYVPSRVILVH